MITVNVELKDAPYTIYLGENILGKLSEELSKLKPTSSLIVTNVTVGSLYGQKVLSIAKGVCRSEILELPDGEQYKNFASLEMILNKLSKMGADRKTVILALGGGVVGDMAGFAAAVFMRGIAFIQLPTTLLAMVDSSVGGKTAINSPFGKNLIGAFHQPRAVLADMSFLKTLPPRQISAGLGEIIKHGLLTDKAYFEQVKNNMKSLRDLDSKVLEGVVARSCEIKAAVVARDEKEKGERAKLNLGHTFGHAIEKLASYGVWLHGEAVGCGLVLAAQASKKLGNLSQDEVQEIEEVVKQAGLPIRIPGLNLRQAILAMRGDKKSSGGDIKFILLEAVGQSYVSGLEERILKEVLSEGGYDS